MTLEVEYRAQGLPAEVTAKARRCPVGQFGGGCRSWDDVPVKIVSLACEPEADCVGPRFDGARGQITPNVELPTLKVDVEVEGRRSALRDKPFAPLEPASR